MQKAICVLVIIYVFLMPLVGLSEEGKQTYTKYTNSWYMGKGVRGEDLTLNEFNILMRKLEAKIRAFKDAFSKLKIEDTNLSYADGKSWDFWLNSTKEDLERALKQLITVTVFANFIAPSLLFHSILNDIITMAYDFARIPIFDEQLNNTHIDLWSWNIVFFKAHLIPLAKAKDENRKLYPEH